MISTISFLCFDFIKNDRESFSSIGGKAFYTGLALANLGEKTVVVTRTDGSESIDRIFSHPLISLHAYPSDLMPKHCNTYFGKEQDKRIQTCFSDNFRLESVHGLEVVLKGSSFIHLGPSRPSEIDAHVMKELSMIAPLALDMDYIIKDPYEGTRLGLEDISEKLAPASIAMISHDDVDDEPETFLRRTASIGPSEVIMTRADKGALIYSSLDDRFYDIDAVRPDKIVDATGAGDTFFAAYLFCRKDKGIEESGRFAASIASKKMERKGPYSCL